VVSAVGLLVAHGVSRAQPAARVPRVGLLGFASEAANAHLGKAFTEGMRDLGWREGKSVEYRFVYANGDVARLGALASELITQNVDVIVVGSSQSAHAAQQATKTTAIVMAGVANAVGAGLVATLANPGGNVTGFSNYEFSMGAKWLDIIRQISPSVKRVGVIYNPQVGPFGKLYVQAVNEASMAANVKIEVAQVSDTNGMESFVDSLSPEGALIVLPDIFTERTRRLSSRR